MSSRKRWRSRSPPRRYSPDRRRRRSSSRDRYRSHHRRRRSSRSRSRSRSWSPRPPTPEVFRRKARERSGLWDQGPPRATGFDQLPQNPTDFSALAPDKAVGTVPLQVSRQSRRLYVGNLPETITETELRDQVDEWMHGNKLSEEPGACLVDVDLNAPKGYAFVEFRSSVEASSALSLDGIQLHGVTLKWRRPRDFSGNDQAGLPTTGPRIIPGVVATSVPEGPNKLYIGNLPLAMTEDNVRELLEAFGELRGFALVSDNRTRQSKGFGFFEFVDHANTERAIAGLDGQKVGDRVIQVSRAADHSNRGSSSAGSTGAISYPPMHPVPSGNHGPGGPSGYAGGSSGSSKYDANLVPISTAGAEATPASLLNLAIPLAAIIIPASDRNPDGRFVSVTPTPVLVLRNMANLDQLEDDAWFLDLLQDVREEAAKHGKVETIVIPRPWADDADRPVPGLGSVFIKYSSVDEAKAAAAAIAGRRYDFHTVLATYHPVDLFDRNIFARGDKVEAPPWPKQQDWQQEIKPLH